MNLRNATIWMSAVMLIVSFVVSVGYNFTVIVSMLGISYTVQAISHSLLYWCFTAYPFAITYFTTKKLRYVFPVAIVLVPTIAHAIGYFYFLYFLFFIENSARSLLLGITVLSLPVMIPAWIAATMLNRYHVKQSEVQSVDGENEVQ